MLLKETKLGIEALALSLSHRYTIGSFECTQFIHNLQKRELVEFQSCQQLCFKPKLDATLSYSDTLVATGAE